MKNSSDTIGNRNRDLPTCNAVPQPTALPAACPRLTEYEVKMPTMKEGIFENLCNIVNSKAIPVQAWTGPERPRGLRRSDFKTSGTRRW